MRIDVNGQRLDIYDAKTKIKISLLDITEPTKRKAYKTEQIKVPASERNRAILGEFDNITSVVSTEQTARYTDGFVSFVGKLLIYEAEIEGNSGYYNIQIVGGNGDWAAAFDGKALTDYDFSALNHDYTYANVTDSWSGFNDYVYPLIDYGKFHGVAPTGSLINANVGVHDMLPAVNVKHILETLFNAEGFNLDDNTSEDLSNYYLTAKNPNIYSQEDANAAKFNASIGGGTFGYGYRFAQTVPASTTQQLDLEEDAVNLNGYTVKFSSVSAFDNNYDNGSNLNTSTGVYTVPTTGTYEFAAKLRLYLQIPPSNFTIVGDDVIITANIRINGVNVASNTFTRSATAQGELIVKDRMRQLTAGDTVQVYITTNAPDITNDSPAKAQTISLSIEQGEYTFFECDTLTRPALNHAWTYDEFLRDIPVLDFMRGIFHLFNIMVITEPDLKNVRLYNYSGFYLSTVSFTPQIDTSKKRTYGFSKVPYISKVGYKIDGNDNRVTNQQVVFTLSNGNDESEIINPIFANTLIANSDQIGYNIPILHNQSTIIQERPYILPSQTFEWLPRLLYFNGTTAHTWTLDKTAQSSIPEFDTTGIDIDDLKTQYTKLHYQRNNGRILECNIDLNGTDISNIIQNNTGKSLRGLLMIDGVKYVINTLEYTEGETVGVELLRYYPVSTGVTIETVTIQDEQTGSGGGVSGGSVGTSQGTVSESYTLLTDGDGEQYTLEYDSQNFGINYCINQSTGLNEIYIIHSISSTQAVISTLVPCIISWRA